MDGDLVDREYASELLDISIEAGKIEPGAPDYWPRVYALSKESWR